MVAPLIPYVREIILENFMSHKYSKVPLVPGLNIISGPNGAGKSSILLGLSVALGQTYTERSRRLSDLIRRGEKLARVSVVFNNSQNNGRRPISGFDTDTVILSRYMSRDGNYWHEINNRPVMKGEVLRFLQRLSINPDNMLLIMHQNMIDVFGAIDAREKLRLVEEAIGMAEYRQKVLETREKLAHAVSEEEATKTLLAKAMETLSYWEGEYRKLMKKRELEGRKRELEVELAWARFWRQEEEVASISSKLGALRLDLQRIQKELSEESSRMKKLEETVERLKFDLDSAYQRLIQQEKLLTEKETRMKILEALGPLASQRVMDWSFGGAVREARKKVEDLRGEVVAIKKQLEREMEAYVNSRVDSAILGFKQELLEKETLDIQRELDRARRALEELEAEASKVGRRIKTERKLQEISDELKVVNVQLASLADVSSDVEKMYLSYQGTVKELEEKAKIAEANRKRALEEVELRKRRWLQEITRVLRETEQEYQSILARIGGRGEIRLANQEDIEEAGVELSVGFRGNELQILDMYVQSGGERTAAIMSFLLALQKRIKSPLRSIDEFEAHLDPKNREELLKGLMRAMGDENAQCLLITPGYITRIEDVANVIVVQNVGGTSQVKVVVQ